MALVLLALSVLAFSGCEKNESEVLLTDAQLISNAKSWYEGQQKSQVSKISIAGKESELILTPNWKTAKVARINNIVAVSTEIKTNILAKFKVEKQYALLVKNDGTELTYRIVDISAKENFTDKDGLNTKLLYETAFAKQGVVFKDERPVTVLNAGSKVQLAIAGEGQKPAVLASSIPNLKMNTENQTCYDAYMVTRVYDQGGNMIDIFQEYMGFQICISNEEDGMLPGGGSGGGTGEGEYMTLEVTNANSLISESEPIIATQDSVQYKEWLAIWHFTNIKYKDNLEVGLEYHIQGQATELLKTKFVNGTWQWVSCINSAINTSGLKPIGVNIVKDGHAVTFINDANVQLAYHVHAVAGTLAKNSPVTTSSRAFAKK